MIHLIQLLVLTIFAQIAPGLDHTRDARAISLAVATVIVEDAEDAAMAQSPEDARAFAPIFGSYAEDAAVMAYWAFRESSLNLKIKGDGGRSVGAWQLQLPAGYSSAMSQARAWRKLLRVGAKRCPASPGSIMWGDCNVEVSDGEGSTSRHAANRRVEKARELLRLALQAQ